MFPPKNTHLGGVTSTQPCQFDDKCFPSLYPTLVQPVGRVKRRWHELTTRVHVARLTH